METEEYLEKILADQTIAPDSDEMKQLISTRDEVEKKIRSVYGGSPTIQYGGSKRKRTMIKESYDLDLICYFEQGDDIAGESLEDIYNNIKSTLENDYYVELKTSALRLKNKDPQNSTDFHVDVVPGRYIDETETDCYIHQSSGEKERLKTNLEVHIKAIGESEKNDIIRLAKLWNKRTVINLKTFVLELLVVKYAKKYQKNPLSEGLISFWQYLKDHPKDLFVEDPANPDGNDLSGILNDSIKQSLSICAENALQLIESENWEGIFGQVKSLGNEDKINAIKSMASTYRSAPKPWCESNE